MRQVLKVLELKLDNVFVRVNNRKLGLGVGRYIVNWLDFRLLDDVLVFEPRCFTVSRLKAFLLNDFALHVECDLV